MADINVVPKHGTNAWMWIVLAIAVIAILFWALAGRTHAAAQVHPVPQTVVSEITSVALSQLG